VRQTRKRYVCSNGISSLDNLRVCVQESWRVCLVERSSSYHQVTEIKETHTRRAWRLFFLPFWLFVFLPFAIVRLQQYHYVLPGELFQFLKQVETFFVFLMKADEYLLQKDVRFRCSRYVTCTSTISLIHRFAILYYQMTNTVIGQDLFTLTLNYIFCFHWTQSEKEHVGLISERLICELASSSASS
jgi:hypothetical protein